VKPLAIVSKGSAENKYECGKTIVAGSFYFELFGENCMKIIITRQIFLSSFQTLERLVQWCLYLKSINLFMYLSENCVLCKSRCITTDVMGAGIHSI
jgi:hypothetical protein